jgi:hypothetical protein
MKKIVVLILTNLRKLLISTASKITFLTNILMKNPNIVLIRKFIGYFSFIAQYLKIFQFYNLFRFVIRLMSLFNLLFSLFIIFMFTDFKWNEIYSFYFLILPEHISIMINGVYVMTQSYLRSVLKNIINYFKNILELEDKNPTIKPTESIEPPIHKKIEGAVNAETNDTSKEVYFSSKTFYTVSAFIGIGLILIFSDEIKSFLIPTVVGVVYSAWEGFIGAFFPNGGGDGPAPDQRPDQRPGPEPDITLTDARLKAEAGQVSNTIAENATNFETSKYKVSPGMMNIIPVPDSIYPEYHGENGKLTMRPIARSERIMWIYTPTGSDRTFVYDIVPVGHDAQGVLLPISNPPLVDPISNPPLVDPISLPSPSTHTSPWLDSPDTTPKARTSVLPSPLENKGNWDTHSVQSPDVTPRASVSALPDSNQPGSSSATQVVQPSPTEVLPKLPRFKGKPKLSSINTQIFYDNDSGSDSDSSSTVTPQSLRSRYKGKNREE